MTPEDVHRITFDQAPFGRRGYQEDAVDDLLELIAAALAGRGALTTEQLYPELPARKGLLARGYHPDQVDAFLERARSEFGY